MGDQGVHTEKHSKDYCQAALLGEKDAETELDVWPKHGRIGPVGGRGGGQGRPPE
jgi:hypothetical protein